MKNIDLFNDYTASVLSELYTHFPVKRSIDARTLCGHTDRDDFGGIVDADGRPSKAFEIACGTIEWLGDSGYLTYASRTPCAFVNVVLTPKGLSLLKSSPDALRSKDTLGERLLRFVTEGSKELARDAVKAVITAAVTGGA